MPDLPTFKDTVHAYSEKSIFAGETIHFRVSTPTASVPAVR